MYVRIHTAVRKQSFYWQIKTLQLSQGPQLQLAGLAKRPWRRQGSNASPLSQEPEILSATPPGR